MHKVIFLLLVGVAVASAFACTENFCNSVRCRGVICGPDEIRNEHGTACGCCPACIRVIKKGDSCYQPPVMGEGLPRITCDKGLHCDSTTQTCE
ncbi:uncharacterized protein CEXT_635611 [Caerostris extrusa]|uniref:Uncharacterized protein n=1 Tax=Caerostris extrusa TaxID=172846 RepID=A0AAV4VZV7_CAEEX|nr:uncharacterized protein CEXT_635611 [Caerostris extrusa]